MDEPKIVWNDTALEAMESPGGEIHRFMEQVADVVLAGARTRAGRRTGRMIREMYSEVGVDEEGVYADIASPVLSIPSARGRARPYGKFQEIGTSKMRPHRYLRPALKDVLKIASKPTP